MKDAVFAPDMRRIAFAAVLTGTLFLYACGGAVGAGFLEKSAGAASEEATEIDTSGVLVPEASGTTVYEKRGLTLDASNTGSGYVMVESEPNEKRVKTRLAGPTDTYTYDQRTDGVFETFPLQMGDGRYSVQVFEQAEGTTYSRVFEQKIDVTLADPEIPFRYPNQYVSYRPDDNAVARSFALTKGMTDKKEIAKRIYRFVADTIQYDYDKAATVKDGYLPVADETLETKKGICFDYSALLATMLRAQGIPTRLEIGHVAPDNLYHAWNRAYLDGTWIFFDATLDGEGRVEQDYTTERIY